MRQVRRLGLLLALGLGLVAPRAQAEAPLRIGISLSDIPRMWGAPDGGFEGLRFGGYLVFEGLTAWDLSSADKQGKIIPGLAESWSVDEANPKRWTFKLREAKFHDGSPFNADAAVWNFDAIYNNKAPQYDASRSGLARYRAASVVSYGKIDDRTIFVETNQPNGFLPYELSTILFSSPARFTEFGGDWTKFASKPSGTGPYKVRELTPRTRLDLEAFAGYWNPNRVPKTKQTSLVPIPDPTARVAALRSGQVDLVETLPPDAIDSLKAAGFKVVTNITPHTWLWRFNFDPAGPVADVRVRRAINLAIDREGIATMLNKTAVPAKGFATPDANWFGKPKFELKYDPAAAKKLLAEAGYGPSKPVDIRVIIASSGGGQMIPLPMNEAIQENLKDVGVNVQFDVVDFSTIIGYLRGGAKQPVQKAASGLNVAMPVQEPTAGLIMHDSQLIAPNGSNWGYYNNPEADTAIRAARNEFDLDKQMLLLARVNEILVDDAAALLVVHDLNPRGLSAKVKGFVQARNWFQDYTAIKMD
ncbi:periplasmic dipeptide transport protein precursor [Variibacter gotjawalensis]|uniref:Periplasmic dipeptide transport protein n=1 Tax=Variibacter gotjawalensis TaxID=1333996 RepID=A0A0S3PYI1_9BRAD|nr:ABC transporter substrate-binding protein [Variibacter gotjawalensis]NIK46819.1 ABC-type transport system substrate-binding protein [Variibacter gotjawalensis]RZS48723.1 peptide/nickel transport system substrate-binding protein [Variibacter gotjawalensis]BAT60982.1 periplasmic dipeptide transport protein precursor [Variibacter gotjawalensis]